MYFSEVVRTSKRKQVDVTFQLAIGKASVFLRPHCFDVQSPGVPVS